MVFYNVRDSQGRFSKKVFARRQTDYEKRFYAEHPEASEKTRVYKEPSGRYRDIRTGKYISFTRVKEIFRDTIRHNKERVAVNMLKERRPELSRSEARRLIRAANKRGSGWVHRLLSP